MLFRPRLQSIRTQYQRSFWLRRSAHSRSAEAGQLTALSPHPSLTGIPTMQRRAGIIFSGQILPECGGGLERSRTGAETDIRRGVLFRYKDARIAHAYENNVAEGESQRAVAFVCQLSVDDR